ncbi:MAG TPA: PA14 domain-containing protein, partial [Bacteroidia bacterium]|nr:PA14 domain-containing protein [Bacteroidia bacterium]
FTGVQDSGTLEIYRDTASAQQWYSTRRVPHIRENWDILSPYPFDPQFSSTNWSTRWKGWISAPMTGDYTFYLMHDGKTTLYLDGRQLLQETTPWQQVWVDTVHVQLEGNRRYWLELDYDHYSEVSRVEFDWEYSIVRRHTVPFMDPAEMEIIPPAHEYGDILLFPNPITDAILNLWVNENEFGTAAVDLRIYDLAGRQFLRYVGKPGSEIQPIDLSRLETGIYIARVTVGIEERVVRLMKL